MKFAIILFLILPAFAFANYMSISDFQSCQINSPSTVFLIQSTCEKEKGEQCAALPPDINCADFDLIDGEFVYNSDKAFARKLKEKAEQDAAQADRLTRKSAKERLKSLKLKGTTAAQIRNEVEAALLDIVKLLPEE